MKLIKPLFILTLFAILFVLVISSPCWATTYYVDATNGNDSNTGTSEATPWKAIAKVNSSYFQPGDFILFKRGEIWREQLTVPSSGSDGSPVTFGAYGNGDKPVINGADLILNWTLLGDNIWQVTLTLESRQVFFNGNRGEKETSVENLDTEYEWCWNSNVLYVYSTSDPDSAFTNPGIEATVRNYSLFPDGNVDYITIQDIRITKSNHSNAYIWYNQDHWLFDNVTLDYSYSSGLWIEGDSSIASDITIQNSDVSYNGLFGVYVTLDSRNTTIRRNNIHHNAWSDHNVDSAGIYCNGSPYGSPSPDYGSGLLVEYNDVHDNGFKGATLQRGNGIWVDIMSGTDGIVRYNRSYNNSRNGIENEYTNDTQIYGNLSFNNAGYGIQIYRIQSGAKVYNNVFFGNTKAGIAVFGLNNAGATTVSNTQVKNNISFNNNGGALYAALGGENDGVNGSGNVYKYNCFGPEGSNFIEWGDGVYKSTYDAWESAYGSTTNSVKSDPLLTNPTSDFTLQPTSPCIDAGIDVGLTRDYEGNGLSGLTWDIGAYEYKALAKPINFRIIGL